MIIKSGNLQYFSYYLIRATAVGGLNFRILFRIIFPEVHASNALPPSSESL